MTAEFNFFQHWYPLFPLEDLNPQRPTPVMLLGMRLVIWKPLASEHYCVFIDECPHRLAPLSEGRISEKTGNLMCSYHGWEFDHQGNCTRIPQAENPKLIYQHAQNLGATSLPSRQAQELLWVWADSHSPELAEKTKLPLSAQVDASQGFVWTSFARDLEYDWQTLVENVADPSHVPFAHHGLQGNRDRAVPLAIKIVQSTPDLIEAQIERKSQTTITFEPPCRLEYAISFGENKQMGLVTYCIPVAPGKSRIVAHFTRNFAKRWQALIPRWLDHLAVRNPVLDGDMIFLHQQERFLEQKFHQDWKSGYQLPTSADRLVIEFRKWFDQFCHRQLPWTQVGIVDPKYSPINNSREALLDRYHQHTQHCHSCRNALRNFQRLEWGILAYFVLSIPITAVLPHSLRWQWGLPLTVVALFGMGIYGGIRFWLEPKFYFVDYIHAEK